MSSWITASISPKRVTRARGRLQSQLHRNEGRVQGLELHREDRSGKCHGIQRCVHQQRADFDVGSGTAGHVHHRGRDENALVTRTARRQTKGRGVRNDLSAAGSCVWLDDAKIADGLARSHSRHEQSSHS